MPKSLTPAAVARIAADHKVLSDPTRVQLLALIDEAGTATILELTKWLGTVQQPTVSHHIAILAAAKLVERRKEGVFVWLKLTLDGTRVTDGFHS
jgi:DNA-binding transcriptional ArsR family regulator